MPHQDHFFQDRKVRSFKPIGLKTEEGQKRLLTAIRQVVDWAFTAAADK